MGQSELSGITDAREKPITVLLHVPIEERYLSIMTRVLTEHGALWTETDEPIPPNVENNDTRMYTVTFPAGTVRIDGIIIRRSLPFSLVLPDKYQLQGAELWPIGLRESDTCINVFMIASGDEIAGGP